MREDNKWDEQREKKKKCRYFQTGRTEKKTLIPGTAIPGNTYIQYELVEDFTFIHSCGVGPIGDIFTSNRCVRCERQEELNEASSRPENSPI